MNSEYVRHGDLIRQIFVVTDVTDAVGEHGATAAGERSCWIFEKSTGTVTGGILFGQKRLRVHKSFPGRLITGL
jgi:hypothetical protein